MAFIVRLMLRWTPVRCSCVLCGQSSSQSETLLDAQSKLSVEPSDDSMMFEDADSLASSTGQPPINTPVGNAAPVLSSAKQQGAGHALDVIREDEEPKTPHLVSDSSPHSAKVGLPAAFDKWRQLCDDTYHCW